MPGPIPAFPEPSIPAFGMYGVDYINNTLPHTGHWFVFVPADDTVFASFESETPVGGNAFVGDTCSAGIPIYAQFTEITLASGRGWAYRATKE